MTYKDPEKQRAYQRQWMAERRLAYLTGKSCLKCGANGQLEIHHRDPSAKLTHNVWSFSESRRLEELAKCDVLCSDCHAKETLGLYRIPEHGTDARYRSRRLDLRCRCVECKRAHAEITWARKKRARLAKKSA